MINKLFGKKDSSITVLFPITGVIRIIEEVPDQAFSTKFLGDGAAIHIG